MLMNLIFDQKHTLFCLWCHVIAHPSCACHGFCFVVDTTRHCQLNCSITKLTTFFYLLQRDLVATLEIDRKKSCWVSISSNNFEEILYDDGSWEKVEKIGLSIKRWRAKTSKSKKPKQIWNSCIINSNRC